MEAIEQQLIAFLQNLFTTIGWPGVFVAMLSFVFGQPALMMFSLIVFFSLLSQVVGDISQLVRYRRGV